jgi:hypothetical protein
MPVAYFDTLSNVAAYAAKIPDNVLNQSPEPYRPQFTTLHASIPRLIEGRFSFLPYLKKRFVNEFKQLVQRVAKQRELSGNFDDYVQKCYIEEETKWYIWGSLHGAFHSLVRSLLHMQRYGVIDESLKLTKGNIYLVFNGNMINYGPYQIETLFLMLTLFEKNPHQVMIMQGEFEREGAWQKTTLVQELQTRFAAPADVIPMERELNELYNTFALALYLISMEGNVVRISFYDKHPLLREDMWSDFLSKKSNELIKIRDLEVKPWTKKLNAYIASHAVKEVPYTLNALTYSKYDDVQAWTLFSSPLEMFRAYYNFTQDVVVELLTGRFFSTWEVTLFEESFESTRGFFRTRIFDIASGRETFTRDPAKRIEELSKKVEIAKVDHQQLLQTCEMQQHKQPDDIVPAD